MAEKDEVSFVSGIVIGLVHVEDVVGSPTQNKVGRQYRREPAISAFDGEVETRASALFVTGQIPLAPSCWLMQNVKGLEDFERCREGYQRKPEKGSDPSAPC